MTRARSSAALAAATCWSTAACCCWSWATSASSAACWVSRSAWSCWSVDLVRGERRAGRFQLVHVGPVAAFGGIAELLAPQPVERGAREHVGHPAAVPTGAVQGLRALADVVEQRVAEKCELLLLRVELGDPGLIVGDLRLDRRARFGRLLEARLGVVRGRLRGGELGVRLDDRRVGVDQALLRRGA